MTTTEHEPTHDELVDEGSVRAWMEQHQLTQAAFQTSDGMHVLVEKYRVNGKYYYADPSSCTSGRYLHKETRFPYTPLAPATTCTSPDTTEYEYRALLIEPDHNTVYDERGWYDDLEQAERIGNTAAKNTKRVSPDLPTLTVRIERRRKAGNPEAIK